MSEYRSDVMNVKAIGYRMKELGITDKRMSAYLGLTDEEWEFKLSHPNYFGTDEIADMQVVLAFPDPSAVFFGR